MFVDVEITVAPKDHGSRAGAGRLRDYIPEQHWQSREAAAGAGSWFYFVRNGEMGPNAYQQPENRGGIVWGHVFMHYFWLKERGSKEAPNA